MNITPRAFIISAEQRGLSQAENNRRHLDLASDLALDGLAFKETWGRERGKHERGYLVVGSEHQAAVARIARDYNQESYIALAEGDRIAYVVDIETNHHRCIGKLTRIADSDACEPGGNWTRVDGGGYYQAVGGGVDLPGGF